jgi:O-succinylbenzoate synthase
MNDRSDVDAARVYSIPLRTRFRGISVREGDVVPGAESLRPVGGHLPVVNRPPVPDPVLLHGSAAAPDRIAWWRARLARVAALAGRPRPVQAG